MAPTQLFSMIVLVAASDCHDGSCAAESTVVLQQKRAAQLAKVRIAKTQRESVEELVNASAELLRTGATPDVQAFTQSTLSELEDTIIPAMHDAHDNDVKFLSEALGRFDAAQVKYNQHNSHLDHLEVNQAEASLQHRTCRLHQEKPRCEEYNYCKAELDTLTIQLEEQTQRYKQATEMIGTAFCETPHDHNEWAFRESSESKFKVYITEGRATIAKRKDYQAKQLECENKQAAHLEEAQVCDQAKSHLELASCTAFHEYILGKQTFETEWEEATIHLQMATNNIKDMQKDRLKEVAALQQVKCMLEKLFELGGRPCEDQEDAAIMNQCAVQADVSAFEVTYPEVPVKPMLDDEPVHACTPGFLAKEFLDFNADACFSNMPSCKVCNEPADVGHANVAHMHHQAISDEAAEEQRLRDAEHTNAAGSFDSGLEMPNEMHMSAMPQR